MSVTRTALIEMARQQADAVSSTRWSPDEVKRALGLAHRQEWARILNAAPMTRAATRSVTTDALGQVALAALDGGSGDTAEVMYRVLAWHDGACVYAPTTYQDEPLTALAGASGPRAYYLFGDTVQVLPVAEGVTYTVAVNHLPTNVCDLSADTATVVFPAHCDLLLAVVAAQVLLRSKAAAEAAAAMDLEASAASIRDPMLDDLARRFAGPTVMRFSDTAASWGG